MRHNVRVFLYTGRVCLPRLAFWGARRAIPAATGPKTGSCPSNVVLGLRGGPHITARDSPKTRTRQRPDFYQALLLSTAPQ